MSAAVLSSRLDLPFYLRLPSKVFATWDPEAGVAAVLPRQRLGQAGFTRTTRLVPEATLLDAPSPPPYLPPGHDVVMTCVVPTVGEIPTLSIDTTLDGGYAELRSYTEITVFLALREVPDAKALSDHRARMTAVLNHFLTMYRLVTQDPWVVPVNLELDIYLIDDAVGQVPEGLRDAPPGELLRNLAAIPFATEVGAGRQYTYRLNTLEDLFPGPILERPFIETLAQTLLEFYELPLHYDLILQAQTQLKRRNYHVSILEAETSFEVYIADVLLRLKLAMGEQREDIMDELEDTQRLGPLMKRLRAVDQTAALVATARGLSAFRAFVGTHQHAEWKRDLYDLRNRVVHGGYRQITFDQAKRGIVVAKAAIAFLEGGLGDLANRIQIYPGVDHLQNTAGRLSY